MKTTTGRKLGVTTEMGKPFLSFFYILTPSQRLHSEKKEHFITLHYVMGIIVQGLWGCCRWKKGLDW